MLFSWLDERRRRKILEQPFPAAWLAILDKRVAHWDWLDDDERTRLTQLIQVFAWEKHWEGAGGLELTDEIRVTIAAEACLLILGLDHALYRQVESIVVYPDTVVAPPPRAGFFTVARAPTETGMPVLGQAMHRGPVVLVWNAVRRDSANAKDGHNVVMHEFAHKLDMLDGGADGVPPLADDATYNRWIEVFTQEYEALKRDSERGRRTWLGDYALTNGAEFFAVATEHFFEKPRGMQRDHAALYELLRDFYRQDTAARQPRTGND
ncbi:MAG: zinc-dependent peptidase [Deltaproteobacteria bacterium]|nr:zinc-dependent peptidase [Nannocystaceae bacterium]